MIFGVYGLLRKEEITELKFENISTYCNGYSVKIYKKKSSSYKEPISFIIDSTLCCNIIKIYMNLFDKKKQTGRLIRKLKDSPLEATDCHIGVNTIKEYTKIIAHYLNLENANFYTCHSLKSTGATLLAEGGASLTQLKIAGN